MIDSFSKQLHYRQDVDNFLLSSFLKRHSPLDNARYFEDGKLVIYKRTRFYSARIHIGPRKYVWRSLRTTDEAKALSEARRLFYKFEEKQEQGLPLSSRSFGKVADEYVASREKDFQQGGKTTASMLKQLKRVAGFWKEYAGKKSIENIDDKILREYIPWRRDYYAKKETIKPTQRRHPSDGTLNWDMMVGKAIVRWAHEMGYRGNKPLPTYTFTRKLKRVRPALEASEIRKIGETLVRRRKEAPSPTIKAGRQLLIDYVAILLGSGMRVGEANNLRLRDVIPFKDDKDRSNYRLIVRGKTGERDVIIRTIAARTVEKILVEKAENDQNDFLFTMPDGSRVKNLGPKFQKALSDAGVMHSSDGEKYTLYSLRHSYAVRALRKGLGVFEIARNMGTSVQMIQTYYGKHATPKTFATRLGD